MGDASVDATLDAALDADDTGVLDTGIPDAVADAPSGAPCTTPNTPDPLCGPALATRCGEDARCESCFGNPWTHSLFYGPEGSQDPTRRTLGLAATLAADGAAWAHLAWITDYPRGGESVVVSNFPLASTDPNDQRHDNLGLASGPTGIDGFTARSVALQSRFIGGQAVEAHLLGLGNGPAPTLFGAVVSATGTTEPRSVASTDQPLPQVAFAGVDLEDAEAPLRRVWRARSDGGELSVVAADALPDGAAVNVSRTLSLPDGDGVSVRGTAGELVLLQEVTGGPVWIWDATETFSPTEFTRSNGGASVVLEASGDYTLALPTDSMVELWRYRCRDGSCMLTLQGSVDFSSAVHLTALAAFPDGGLALAATLDRGRGIEVRVVNEDLEALPGWDNTAALYQSDSDATYNELHATIIDSPDTRYVLVGAHHSMLASGSEQVSLLAISLTSRCEP